MGKKTGFMEYKREKAPSRPPYERLADWQPIYLPMAEERLHRQAARCMDCGLPFCHTGQTLNGMTSGCPLGNLVPEWNDLVYRGLWREAYERLEKTNNFPEFTGLVCPAPCEAACTLALLESPVTIKSIEWAIVDRAFDEGWVEVPRPPHRTGRRAAVIGSGPAGLACADELNRRGHCVTVFERDAHPGGLLFYGIPGMKLEKSLVQQRVSLLAEAGITFMTNTEVGVDFPASALLQEFDATVLCTGATRPRDLPVPGRELAGIEFAVDYLHASTTHLLGESEQPVISAAGKDVIVIGGGDTGTDCVATSLRQGCRSLVQFEILAQPPAHRPAGNPWPQWPRIYRVDYGQEEAAARFGSDPRRYCLMTTAFTGEEGVVAAVNTVEVSWERANGSGPHGLPGSERVWPAQLVLLAMGFLGPEQSLPRALGVKLDERGLIGDPAGRFATNVPGVFSAGDARRGQSLVVWAIREGRDAAAACHRYLLS